jgi:hypothetical protein
MTKHVHMAVYDTLADWEVGHATAHINSDDWQREPGRYRVRTVGAASGTRPVDFAREVFAVLDLYTPEVLASWFKLYGLGDPSGYFELMGETA